MINNELKIIDSVCTGCSACTEACVFEKNNEKPLQLTVNKKNLNVPRINAEACRKCMMCFRVCPSEAKNISSEISFENYINKLGNCYYGYSLDFEHRFESATAGIVTETAAYLLDTKHVDGVVSSYQNEDNEIITEIFTDSAEVKKTRGSIYRQVPVLNGILKKIESGNFKKLLFIGLPCQIAGLKMLLKINKQFAKIDFIFISLFCKQTKTEEFSDYERKILKAKPNEKINYRGQGWTGVTSVKSGQSLPFTNIKFSLMWGSFAFTPDYCFACCDPLGANADISVGDAWLKEYYSDKAGSSVFITNSEKGRKIIEEIAAAKKIFIKNETKENIIKSQDLSYIKFKTSNIGERIAFFGNLKNCKRYPLRFKILFYWIKLNKKIVENIYSKSLIFFIPEFLLKIYGRIITFVFAKTISRSLKK